MNQMVSGQGAPYVGAAAAQGMDSTALTPMFMRCEDVKAQAVITNPDGNIIEQLNEEQLLKLSSYLNGRLSNGLNARDKRIKRYSKIDRLVSTWQKLDPEESQRELAEENTGKAMALPFNMPILATHLNDMVSFFAEALAPIANPFFSASGAPEVQELLKKFNEDAVSHDYFSQLCETVRALLKYNLGGFRLRWDTGFKYGVKTGDPGNDWRALDMYNTLWDPSIRNPKDIPTKAEWAATVTLENRLELIRQSVSGNWVGLDEIIEKAYEGQSRSRFYKEAAMEAALGEEGQDSRSSANGQRDVNWGSYGIGLVTDLGPEVDGFEVTDMICHVVSAQFGLLTDAERKTLTAANRVPNAFIEPWRFIFVNEVLVSAERLMPLEQQLGGEKLELPFYLCWLTQDQLKEAQRSFMELMKGFQRFASAMYNIYVAGMRKNVWGITAIDETVLDGSRLKKGDTVGVITSKKSGVDLRQALVQLTNNAGVDQALQAVDSSLNLKDKFFPSQNMPNQVAGIDRAVSSQVATVVQGATRSMRTILRMLDSGLMLPARMAGYRNLKLNDSEGVQGLTDEQVSKLTGSGIETIESERVSEKLWKLLTAVIQNQESMQTFDVPKIMDYLSRVDSLSVSLADFTRAPPQQAVAAPGQPDAAAAAAAQMSQ